MQHVIDTIMKLWVNGVLDTYKTFCSYKLDNKKFKFIYLLISRK